MKRPLASSTRKPNGFRRRKAVQPNLEPLEGRLVLSLVAVSGSDAQINVTASIDQTVPSVAMDANGDYVVAWSKQEAPQSSYLYDVEARVYNAAGQPQTGELTVASVSGVARPSVAMEANGDFVVSWQVLDTSTYLYGVSAQRFNLAGQAKGSLITINNGSSDANSGSLPEVAIDSAGDFVIAYQGYDSNSHGVFAQRYNSSGAAQGSTFRVNTPETDNQGAPSAAMDSVGNFVITWEDGGTTQTAGVYAQRYNASGVAQGGNTAISTVIGAADPSVAMEPNGQFVVAWQFVQQGTATGVEARRFDASGNALTSVVVLSTPESYEQGNAAVAIDSEGDFVVAWESYGVGGTASSLATILAQRVNSGGTLIGPTQFQPSTQSGDGQTHPMIASNAGGNAIIVWQSAPSAHSSNVFGRLYDYVNDAPTINTPSNVTINENAGQQTVNLTGITAGGGETQTLTVFASSNNSALINPNITYTSPSSTGTLTFTPTPNTFGMATITVTMMDDGGTQNGGVDTKSVQFTVTVNQGAATVTAVTSTTSNGTYGVGSVITITVGWSKAVVVTGTPQLALNSGGTASYSTGSGTSTSIFTYTVAAGQNTPKLDYTGTTALSLNGGTIFDTVTNPNAANLTLPAPGSAGSIGGTKSIAIDATAPTVTAVTSTTSNGTYGVSSVITITVGWSKAVVVTGTPQLALNSGGTASYSTGSGTSTLTFTYTVAAGQNTPKLDYTGTTALSLNGGTIFDTATNPNAANLTLPAPGSAGSLSANKSIQIDTVAPTVLQYDVIYGVNNLTYNLIGSTRFDLPWTITGIKVVFSKPIAAGDQNSLTGLTTTSFAGLGTNTLTWSIAPLTLGSLATALLGTGPNGIEDAAGNELYGGSGFAQSFKVLYGDVNGDGVVSASDIAVANSARFGPYSIFADLNGDGVVDINDVTIARKQVGTHL